MDNGNGVLRVFLQDFLRFEGDEQRLLRVLNGVKQVFLEKHPDRVRLFGKPPEEGLERMPWEQMYPEDHYATGASVNLVELTERVMGITHARNLREARKFFKGQDAFLALGAEACEMLARFPKLIPAEWQGLILFIGDVYGGNGTCWVKALDCRNGDPQALNHVLDTRRENYLLKYKIAVLKPPD